MRYLLFFLISFLLVSCSDNITGNKPQDPNDFYWSKNESPIIIEGKFNVPLNETLVIEAGTIVSFQSTDDPNGNYTDEVGWIESFGNIRAIGAENDSIKFISQTEGAWGGIIFRNSTINNFVNCHFENAAYVWNSNELLRAAIHCVESYVNISSSTFHNCRMQSIYADSASVVSVNNSIFYKNTSYENPSVYIYAQCESSASIVYCNFSGFPGGVRLSNNNYSIVSHSDFNTICECIYSYESNEELIVENNHFLNGGTAVYISKNQSAVKILNNIFDGCEKGINLWLNYENYIQGNLFMNCDVGTYSEASHDEINIYNSTFVNNETCIAGDNFFVYNSIISGNTDYFQQVMGMGSLTITQSLIPFYINCVNVTYCIVGESPQFVDVINDFHLSSSSPCIDYGYNYTNIIINYDLDSNTRITGESIDLGSYEYTD